MALFVAGSIIAWFVVIPFMSADAVYTGFLPAFDFYGGVAFQVLGSAIFWFYWPMATVIALLPTIITRIVRLDLFPNLVDDVRLLQKKEGKSIFKRRKIHRKTAASFRRASVKRSGYAFAQESGFGKMISTGRAFGMNEGEIEVQQHRRLSQLIVSGRSTPKHPPSPHTSPEHHFSPPTSPTSPTIAEGIGASLVVGSSVVMGTEVTVEIHDQPSSPEVDEQIEKMVKVGIDSREDPDNLEKGVAEDKSLVSRPCVHMNSCSGVCTDCTHTVLNWHVSVLVVCCLATLIWKTDISMRHRWSR